jgi:hypothetical protein
VNRQLGKHVHQLAFLRQAIISPGVSDACKHVYKGASRRVSFTPEVARQVSASAGVPRFAHAVTA